MDVLREAFERKEPKRREELIKRLLVHFLAGGLGDVEDPFNRVPVTTSRLVLGVLVANMGNFNRSRKHNIPDKYWKYVVQDFYKETPSADLSSALLVDFLAFNRSHLMMIQEASTLSEDDLNFLKLRGWTPCRNKAGDLMCAARTNDKDASVISKIA